MEITEFEGLLQEVNKVITAHEEEKNRLKESFNFFKILGISTKENYHSKFITELLNPKGLHGCGNLFLKIFVETIPILKKISVENLYTGHFKTELHMGPVRLKNLDPDGVKSDSEGGRADILIKINGHIVLIENKINAADQPEQLERYHQYKAVNTNYYSSCDILYLTPYGRPPSIGSCGELEADTHFHCISYKYHIHKWLEKCIDTCPDQPVVKETIKGYFIVIKFLTKQTSDHKMHENIKKILLGNEDYLKAAKELSIIINDIKNDNNNKIQKVYDLLDVSKISFIIKKEIKKMGCGPDEGYNMFTLSVLDTHTTIVVCTDDDMFCYPYSEGENINFENCKELKEPYNAENFIEAFVEDLKMHFK